MALEVKVFRDLGAYHAKAWFGFTGRQFLALCGIIAVVSVGIGLTLGLGLPDWTQYVFYVLIIPLTVWGWIRPSGLDVEEYMGYVKDFHVAPRVLTYVQPCMPCVLEQARGQLPSSTHTSSECTLHRGRTWSGQVDVSKKSGRKSVNVFETQN